MKNLLLTLFALCYVIHLSAQGNVYVEDTLSIGTQSPNAELHLKGNMATNWGFAFRHYQPTWGTNSAQTWLQKSWSSTNGDMLYLGSTGNRSTSQQSAILLAETGTFIGRGSDAANSLSSIYARFTSFGLDVEGTVRSSATTPRVELFDDASSEDRLEGVLREADDNIYLDAYWGDLIFRTGDAGTASTRMTIDEASGGVGIGTSVIPSGYLLAVDGNVITEEVRVELSGSWPDYVFQDDYQLRSIEELDESIKENGHLPGIPSAQKVENDGLHLGDMQKRMMEKIEELSLYIIQLNEENKALKTEMEHLKEVIKN